MIDKILYVILVFMLLAILLSVDDWNVYIPAASSHGSISAVQQVAEKAIDSNNKTLESVIMGFIVFGGLCFGVILVVVFGAFRHSREVYRDNVGLIETINPKNMIDWGE